MAATATANPVVGVGADIIARPAYQSSYSVNDKITGDQKSAIEVRDGDVTKGSYSLVQPDGVLRTVNYISTPLGGFQAQVINKGIAGHPAPAVVGKGLIGGVGLAGPAVVGVGKGVIGGVGLAAPAVALGGASVVGSGLGLGVGGLGWGAGLAGINGVGLAGINGLGLAGINGLGLAGINGVGLKGVGLNTIGLNTVGVNTVGLGAVGLNGLGLKGGLLG